MTEKIRHKVVIQLGGFFHKHYRYRCQGCGETGPWHRTQTVAIAQGWYHDDVTLFQMLTSKGDDSSSA